MLWHPNVKPILGRVPFVRQIYNGWSRIHPFDAAHGTDTSGLVTAVDSEASTEMAAMMSPYAGSQPSIVRAGLSALPNYDQYAFVDLGCGKGRPLVVASELPFHRVIGVELAPKLADVARANAAVIAARYPKRTPIEVVVGDATAISGLAPNVVYFMYHPFSRPLTIALLANIERQLVEGLEHAFFMYYNPVHGDVLDHSPGFARWSAETHAYAPGELGYGPDLEDTLVIWQTIPGRYPAHPGAERRIVVNNTGGSSARLEG